MHMLIDQYFKVKPLLLHIDIIVTLRFHKSTRVKKQKKVNQMLKSQLKTPICTRNDEKTNERRACLVRLWYKFLQILHSVSNFLSPKLQMCSKDRVLFSPFHSRLNPNGSGLQTDNAVKNPKLQMKFN